MKRWLQSTRLSGALSIALVLVVGFAGLVHEALVPHGICAEHGESVELPSGALARKAPDADTRAPKIVDGGKSKAASHEHCDLASFGRTRSVLATRIVPVLTAASEPCEPLTQTSPSPEPSVPLLLLAPKHSPPAIA